MFIQGPLRVKSCMEYLLRAEHKSPYFCVTHKHHYQGQKPHALSERDKIKTVFYHGHCNCNDSSLPPGFMFQCNVTPGECICLLQEEGS